MIEEFKKELGSGFKTAIDELDSDANFVYPLNCAPIDAILGGGVHSGKIYEVFGWEGSGKTTVALEFCKAFCDWWTPREEKYVVLWVESEFALDKVRAKWMGCNVDKSFLISEAYTVEEGFGYMEKVLDKAIQKNYKLFIVWDTIGSAPTENEKKGDKYGGGMMEKPRIISSALQKLTPEFAKVDAPLVLVNQMYGGKTMFGSSENTPGGNKIKFHASTRIQMTKSGKIFNTDLNGEETKVGIYSKMFTKKNKLMMEEQTCEVSIVGERGFDKFSTLLNFLKTNNLIKKAGGWKKVKFKDEEYSWQVDEKLRDEIIPFKCPELMDYFNYLVYKHYTTISP